MPSRQSCILYVLDSSRNLDENDKKILEIIKEKKAVFLYNKSDLNPVLKIEEIKKIANAPVIKISAKHGQCGKGFYSSLFHKQ